MPSLLDVSAVITYSSNLVLASYILYKLSKISSEAQKKEKGKPILRSLMFPDGGFQCNYWTAGDCTSKSCTLLHHITNKTRLKQLLESAEGSIDVCVFVVSCAVLLDTLIAAHKKGIKIRIICDNMKISGSAYKIKEANLPVRVDNSPSMMHHKFIILDKQIVLTGSYNWTASGAAYNRENVFITDENHVAEQFHSEFEKLWDKFEGSTDVRYEPISPADEIRNRFVHRENDKS